MPGPLLPAPEEYEEPAPDDNDDKMVMGTRMTYTYLIKADEIYLSTYIDPLWADAKDASLLQPPLGIDNARGQGSRQSRRHCNCDDIKDFLHHLLWRLLGQKSLFSINR